MVRLWDPRILLLVTTLIALMMSEAWGSSLGPREQIQKAAGSILEVARHEKLSPVAKKALIHAALRENFDFEEVSSRALARHWQPNRERALAEFVPLFIELIEAAYMNFTQIASVKEISYGEEMIEGDYASVYSKVTLKNDDALGIVYRLHRKDGEWRIYDVLVMGISLVANYRAQFNKIIRQGSFDKLLERMRSKKISD